MATAVVGDRHLEVAEALGQEVEGQHLCVVVVVDDLGGGRRFGRQRPEAALAVADAPSGQERERRGEQRVADPAVREFNTRSAAAWGDAQRAAGADGDLVDANVAATTQFYVPPEG